MEADLIIKNIGNLVTMRGTNGPRIKEEMNNIEILKNAYVAVKNGKILDIGQGHIMDKLIGKNTEIHDAKGLTVTPGLVDSHTHLVHGGSRENEFALKISGVSYIDILKRGGGILSTVKSTKEASFDELYNKAKKSLDIMLEYGVTTVEAKSGYGLEFDTEVKQLKVAKKLNENHPVDIVSTFLGAHAVPIKYKENPDEFVDIVIEMLPKVKELAEFVDVFCEEGVFSVDQTKKILQRAKEIGYKLKLHADEIVPIGGAELAAELKAISADHLMAASENGMKLMAENKVIANILPGTSFNLMKDYANARKMIEVGVAVSLSTDYNPGSCPTENIQFIMQLGSLALNMTPSEVLTAVTINGAYAVDKADEIGSIEVGKKADLVVFDAPNIEYIIYHFGINHVYRVYKEGKLVVDDRRIVY
ncbi:imidazolonepropionase [Tepidibacter thalassicus]|uniref:Imidazolonepropionase n=1 Tax=Tepidibacter thalassicus DSM 15285 TaxID=1123350 RepID=A0A1M5PG67_9FIRM|nr:imidazolonepropionase [Tepidibacter thalassicus]SHH00449.1 imidazolonepropionase [Tepidibacter thalassicus DSM 15285]